MLYLVVYLYRIRLVDRIFWIGVAAFRSAELPLVILAYANAFSESLQRTSHLLIVGLQEPSALSNHTPFSASHSNIFQPF